MNLIPNSAQEQSLNPLLALEGYPSAGFTIEFLSLNLGILTRRSYADVPQGLEESRFLSILRTPEEISVVAETVMLEGSLDEEDRLLTGWSAFRIIGEVNFSWMGVIAKISSRLASAGINIYSLSTWNTDYILIRQDTTKMARKVLAQDFQVVNKSW